MSELSDPTELRGTLTNTLRLKGTISTTASDIAPGAPGDTDFLALTDTPDSYAGMAGYVVAVNDDEDGLEFIDAAGGIEGPQGIQGIQGIQGVQGVPGDAADIQAEIDAATELDPPTDVTRFAVTLAGVLRFVRLDSLKTALTALFDTLYAPIAKGVTGGDSHDHSGGDGGTIAYASLSGTPDIAELARDALGTALVAGTGITVTPNDGADTIAVASTITQYTDGAAQAVVDATLAALDSDDIAEGVTNLYFSAAEETKLAGIEALADVTDAGNISSSIHGATLDATPLDADEVPGLDSSASFALIRWTWTGIKAFLKTYFDTLYTAINTAVLLTGTQTVAGIKTWSDNAFFSANLGLGTTDIETTATNYASIQLGTDGILVYGKSGGVGGLYFASNAYKDGVNWKRRNNGDACLFDFNASGTSFFWAQSDGTNLADATITWVTAWSVGNTGGMTFIAPTIADFTNAPHDHGDANDGGSILLPTALTLSGLLTLTPTTQTIAAGVITPASVVINLDTEGAAATDDLVTITAGAQGQLILLKTVSDARDITIKNGTGNIDSGGNDRVLHLVQDMWLGIYTGSAWRELVFSESFSAREGTWLPTITGSTGASTMTYTIQEGSWWRTGKLYHYTITIVINAITVAGTGNLRVSLPVAAAATPLSGDGTCRLSGVDLPAGPLYYTFNPTAGQAYGNILGINDNTTNTTVAVTTLANGDAIIISGQFIAA